jgi:uncharacterized membrane protein YfcA
MIPAPGAEACPRHSSMPDFETWQWILGAFAALAIGIAKSGVPGIGAFIVPLMVMTVGDARYAAAWTVVMLSTGDVFAVIYWRRHARLRTLLSLVPWVGVGMAGGAVALALPEIVLRRMVGAIILIMVFLSILQRKARTTAGGPPFAYGIPAGFATTVANSAGPVMNMYLLAERLPKEQFVATAAWFFLVVNLTKVPIYIWYDLFSSESLTFNLMMAPVVVFGNVAGIWLIHRIPQRAFEILILLLTMAAALALFL